MGVYNIIGGRKMIVADYDTKWEHLSKEHKKIDLEIQQILEDYKNEKQLKSLAYAILGTYGIGKIVMNLYSNFLSLLLLLLLCFSLSGTSITKLIFAHLFK